MIFEGGATGWPAQDESKIPVMNKDNRNEEWRPIAGYEGMYSVSSLGRIRSERRITNYKTGRKHWTGGFIMRQYSKPLGYMRIGFFKHGVQQFYSVHVLVLSAFSGPRPDQLMECAHLDGNPSNNSADNLRWVTSKENALHKVLHGTNTEGTKHHAAKLNEALVLEMRDRYKHGERLADITRSIGLSKGTVWHAIKGRTWKCIGRSARPT